MTDETGWQLDNDVRKIRLLTNARQLLNSPQIPEKFPDYNSQVRSSHVNNTSVLSELIMRSRRPTSNGSVI